MSEERTEHQGVMISASADPRFVGLPKWVQRHIRTLESALQVAQQREIPRLEKAELWLSGERLHIRNLDPDTVDVNFAGIFLDVCPQATNHITLRGSHR